MPEEYYIWSFEHDAWWKPHHSGYSVEQMEAGRYSLDEALHICRGANRMLNDGVFPNEAMIPIF